MGLHDFPFVRRELAALEQNMIRNADLSDVVQRYSNTRINNIDLICETDRCEKETTASSILDMLRRGKKQAALVAIIAAAVVIPASLYAGSEPSNVHRTKPSSIYHLNSITNNSNYGDERDFVMIKESTAPDSAWSSTATAQPGKEYTVRMYVHNNAADTNLVAENVRASASIKQGGQQGYWHKWLHQCRQCKSRSSLGRC